jgi:alpha-L-fucosidase
MKFNYLNGSSRCKIILGAAAAACVLSSPFAAMPVQAQIKTQASASSLDPHAGETPAQRNARMKWWREARYGMFIHWGLYAQLEGRYQGKTTDGRGEWIMSDQHIPVAEYASNAKDFNPTQFNAKEWVALAKAAGMKYIVITAKHHEGFAMYHTAVDGFNIYDATSFKRDPIAELAAECKKAGIKFGVYYSQNLDWRHPGGGKMAGPWDDAQNGSFHDYINNVVGPQVRELVEKFDPAVIWWDIPGQLTPDEVRTITASFSKDPNLIYDDRMGGDIPGDYATPEQYIPPTGYKGDWETCMTINDTWGYKVDDQNFKSTKNLLQNLIDIASKGGNYLLNVGPSPQGTIPGPEADRLREIGAWLSKNGESIYGTTSNVTVKGRKLYVNVFSWPDDGLTLPGLQTKIVSAKALATGEKLEAIKNTDGVYIISKPATLDPISTAVVVQLSGAPEVDNTIAPDKPGADGSFTLLPATVTINGETAQVEHNGDAPNIGYWTDQSNTVDWTLSAPAGAVGLYNVSLRYSCDPSAAGSEVEILIDGQSTEIAAKVAGTDSWSSYVTVKLNGSAQLSEGKHVLEIKPISIHNVVMNLQSVILTPVGK